MIRTAIVEDDAEYALTLKKYLNRYAEENGAAVSVTQFSNAVTLLENYSGAFDLIFMDIRMPYLNGMDAAHRLRELDKDVLLVFVTNMTQYAVAGYEVDALDYIVKPVNYFEFALKMKRATSKLRGREDEKEIVLNCESGMVKLRVYEIRYVETDGHRIIYYTPSSALSQYSSLSSAENKLKNYGFARCNSCYLVNLRYVRFIKNYTVNVDGTELQISQPRKKKFVAALMAFTEESRNG